jgi:hypothetical protein
MLQTSIWYEKYRPQLVKDLVLPQDLKDKLQGYVDKEELPNIGLFSSEPGCLLPGTNITVFKEPVYLDYNSLHQKYGITKEQFLKLKRYTYSNDEFIDDNLINSKLLDIIRSKGKLAYMLWSNFKSDVKYKDKHLKLMHWVYKSETLYEACKNVKRIRSFSAFFDFDPNNHKFKNYKQENLPEVILGIKFKILYNTNITKISDICKNIDKNTTIDFWTFRGFSENEAKEKISIIQKTNMSKRVSKYLPEKLKYQRGYGQTIQKFLDLGFNEYEAKEKLAHRQRTFALDVLIEKYGESAGTQRWIDRQIKWQNTLPLKSQDELQEIHKRKGNGYNDFKHPLGIKGYLYYIRFCNDDLEFWKIGITKKSLNSRFNFKKINLIYDIIFCREYDEIRDAFLEEQRILSSYNNKRVIISLQNFYSTECFNEDVLKDYNAI